MAAQPPAHDHGFGSYLQKVYDAEPEANLVTTFLAEARTPRHLAVMALDHEWMDIAFGPREGTISLAKLAWWRDELARYGAGVPQHPITRAMAASADPIPIDDLQLAFEGVAPLATIESPATSAELLAAFRPYAVAVLPWWGASDRDTPAIDAYAAVLAVQQLRHWPRFARAERALVPLDALAGAGVNRAQLLTPEAAAAAAAIAARLARELGRHLRIRSRGPLAARVATSHAVADVIARQPERALSGEANGMTFGLPWRLWSIARRSGGGA